MIIKPKTISEWEKSGLLQDISENRKQMVVNCFNIAIDWLSEDKIVSIDERIDEIEVVIFPLFYRIAKVIDLNKTQVLEICKEFRQSWLHADMTRYVSFDDPEAEFLKAFAEMKINQYKNNDELI